MTPCAQDIIHSLDWTYGIFFNRHYVTFLFNDRGASVSIKLLPLGFCYLKCLLFINILKSKNFSTLILTDLVENLTVFFTKVLQSTDSFELCLFIFGPITNPRFLTVVLSIHCNTLQFPYFSLIVFGRLKVP